MSAHLIRPVVLTPTAVPSFCPVGSTYRRTKGYRKVVGDTCQGGMEDQFAAETVSCPINSIPQFLLYAARTYIRRLTLGDHIETTIPLGSGLQNAIAIDYDYNQNCIYWADITLDTIKRTFLNGSDNKQHRAASPVLNNLCTKIPSTGMTGQHSPSKRQTNETLVLDRLSGHVYVGLMDLKFSIKMPRQVKVSYYCMVVLVLG
ncbi:Sortilin- receptor [Desmophyllum pertusum]|uniref:Sortilin- receptor n=1 Tax=Desmophyllum pertusum TaxID=174260 RepID=A0A9X0D2J5_9CNID|nr:Sortilin- receptor [Desmophyllum pertusum]